MSSSTGGYASSMPVVNGVPTEVADGVFVIPDDRVFEVPGGARVPLVPNVGIVVGERAALVIDPGLGTGSGRVVRRIAEELAGERPLFLTATHFHPEHGWAAGAFGPATVVYNRLQQEEFEQKRDGFLEVFRGFGAEIAAELEGLELVDPHLVYGDSATLDLGHQVVELRSVGPAHSRGDQSVFVRPGRVLFTGDLVENGFAPIFPPGDPDVDGDRWIAAIADFVALDPATVVPGHGEIGDLDLLGATAGYLEMLRSETHRLADQGETADAIAATLIPRVLAAYPDWDHVEAWIASGVDAFLAGRG
jgi:glyoxylase-like metal-dependent hydrolase (beta-lactamase superfamily II)